MSATTAAALASQGPRPIREARRPAHDMGADVILETRGLDVHYGSHHALHGASLQFRRHEICALIGPSGCGKSTYLRSLNLMNREIAGCRMTGEVVFGGRDINTPQADLYELRRSIGMVFQRPNPFRKSIYENVAFAPRRHGLAAGCDLDALVEESLRGAALWDEVKDGLDRSALSLSGGQQQRLCIARALAMHPDVILLDEPASALDPISTRAIEELMRSIAHDRSIVIVTHSMEQARRISDSTAFFYKGDVVEHGRTEELFARPRDARLRDYLAGMFS